jgi:hypothetical protein
MVHYYYNIVFFNHTQSSSKPKHAFELRFQYLAHVFFVVVQRCIFNRMHSGYPWFSFFLSLIKWKEAHLYYLVASATSMWAY